MQEREKRAKAALSRVRHDVDRGKPTAELVQHEPSCSTDSESGQAQPKSKMIMNANIEIDGDLSILNSPHECSNRRYVLAQKSGILSELIPIDSVAQLAQNLRVINWENRCRPCKLQFTLLLFH